MKDIALTVIVPIYNKEKLLRQCLDSFAREKFVGYLEVLAIDDGSADGSLSIAQEYRDRYPEIYKVISKENGGVGSVMNAGLKLAAGKYIREVDADDYIYPDALGELLLFLNNCTSDIVLTPFEDVNEGGEYIKSHYITGMRYGQEYPLDEALKHVEMCIQSMTIRRGLLTDNHFSFEETRYYIDMQLVCECVYYASTCAALNSILYCYRLGQEGQSVSLKNYIVNRNSFKKQTELSLERYSRAQEDTRLSEFKKNLCEGWARVYSSMLYIIYLLDGGESSGEECKEFDNMLYRTYPIIYGKLGEYALLRKLRDSNFENLEYYKKELTTMIEDFQSLNKEDISLGELYSLGLDGDTIISKYKLRKQRDKFQMYFQLSNHWLMNCQSGITAETYFSQRGFREIAIYGCGQLGERLYQELLNSEVRVVYGIDKMGASVNSDLPVYTLEKELKEVDAVVVTPVSDFPGIRNQLKMKIKCPIISLEDIIYRS